MILTLAYSLAAFFTSAPLLENGEYLTIPRAKNLLYNDDVLFCPELFKLGDRAFSTYMSILNDDQTDDDVRGRIYVVLSKIQAERSLFLPYALTDLTSDSVTLRYSAMVLIRQIGQPKHCTPVAALLADSELKCLVLAVDTLAVIGDENALLALDVWLANGNRRDDKRLQEYVRKYRNQLKERLAKEKQHAQPTKQ